VRVPCTAATVSVWIHAPPLLEEGELVDPKILYLLFIYGPILLHVFPGGRSDTPSFDFFSISLFYLSLFTGFLP
jgi:hypothetical protein